MTTPTDQPVPSVVEPISEALVTDNVGAVEANPTEVAEVETAYNQEELEKAEEPSTENVDIMP